MKFKTVKLTERIIVVQVKNKYDRAMLFCRAQEFYESPCSKFRGQKFSIWDYFRWYSENKAGCFSYTKDFTGFNMPLIMTKKCYDLNDAETPYDEVMMDIVDRYFVNGEKKYLIGVDSMKGSTFDHELCHALYYTDDTYRETMDEITGTISSKNKSRLKKNLSDMGYHLGVFKDEVQAYMSTELNGRLVRGVTGTKKMHSEYRLSFKRLKPIM